LPNITGATPPITLDTTSWNVPKDIKLEYDHFNVPGSICLLIGADIFYEILRLVSGARPGNYPVLQETALGWAISGRFPAVTTRDSQHTFMLKEDKSVHVKDKFCVHCFVFHYLFQCTIATLHNKCIALHHV
jgi:hypothetical protein